MFIHSWAIAVGAVGLAIPLLIHLLTRPRPARVPTTTLRFLREVVQQRRTRSWLRDMIVLAMRALAIGLIAFAVARPRGTPKSIVDDSSRDAAVRIVMLDVSQSMAALDHGAALIERARTVAAEHLRYRNRLAANLILAGARPQAAFTQPSQNFEALRDALARATPLPERCDADRSLALAAELLAPQSADDKRRRELIIVSDFQRANWSRADFSQLPADTRLQFESVAPSSPLPNLAVLRSEVRGRASLGASAQLEVEVGNFTSSPRDLHVEVVLSDATFRLNGLCPPNGRATLTQSISLRDKGWKTGTVRLLDTEEDSLFEDNQTGLVLEVAEKPVFAMLTRQPATQRPSSSHYVECALVPDLRLGEGAAGRVVRMDPDQLSRDALFAADMVVIDHPGKLSPDLVAMLAGLMRRGRPILYVAAEPVDANNLRTLMDAAGSSLQLPVEFGPPPGQSRRDLFLTSVRFDAAPFQAFGDSGQSVFGRYRFGSSLASRRIAGTMDDDILAQYSDGSAFLVVSASDAGSLAVLNAVLTDSNLPTSQGFVPLVAELAGRLMEQRRTKGEALCGEPLVARLPLAANRNELKVVADLSQSDDEGPGELADEGIGIVWRWPSPDRPGVYRVARGDQTVFALPVRISDEESALDSLPGDVFTDRLAAGRVVAFRDANRDATNRDTTWTWLLVACVLCLIGEIVALYGFRS